MTKKYIESHKIKLKPKDLSLANILEALIEHKSNLIRKITAKQMEELTQRSQFDSEDPFIIIKVYKTHEDKKNNNPLHMVFGNHGQVFFCNGEVLETYKLDEPHFFWDFRLEKNHQTDLNLMHGHHVEFSNDSNSIENWEAYYNYDEIFSTYGLEGGHDLAGFAGFFFIEN